MHRPRVIACAVATCAAVHVAGPVTSAAETAVDAPTQGMLVLASRDPGLPRALPPIRTDVYAKVAGFGAEVAVKQRFNNPFASALEAVYVFPLPHGAAVGRVHVEVTSRDGETGEQTRRSITGHIQPRDEALARYRAARREGRTGVLLEQERPNVFTQSVANVPPGGDVEVEMVYQVPLRYDEGEYEFVYPMVVGPRYVPGAPRSGPRRGGGRSPDTDQVPDGSRITPPVRQPGSRSGHDISVRVELDPGVKIRKIHSPTHQITVTRVSGSRTAVEVGLPPSQRIPNKDLVVRYRLAGRDPALAVTAERAASEGYVSLLIEPPAPRRGLRGEPIELVFLIDTSRSMAGEPLSLIKRALRHALGELDEADLFQIVRFSDNPSALTERPVPATPANARQALSQVNALATGPDSELSRALGAVLAQPAQPGRLRVVCVMTDGLVGNDRAVLAEAERRLRPDTRVFAFGVGSSVNRHLLDALAVLGRGAVHYALLAEPPGDQVRRLFERLRAPLITDVAIDWGGLAVRDVVPARIPDVFAGHPVVVFGRFVRGGRGRVTVRGRRAGKPVALSVDVALPRKPTKGETLGRQWARARIRALAATGYQRADAATEAEIIRLALAHELVSEHTAFVAVDDQGAVQEVSLGTYQVPVEMPEGVQYDAAIGDDTRPGGGADDPADARDAQPEPEPGAVTRQRPIRRAEAGDGDEAADDDGDGGYDLQREAPMDVGVSGSIEARLIARAGTWRRGVGAGLGALVSSDDGAIAAAAVRLRLDRAAGGGFAIGGQLAVLAGLDGERGAGGLLVGASYLGLVNGTIALSAGAGPSLDFDGQLGLGYAAQLDVRIPYSITGPLGVGLALRLDGARTGDEHLRAVTLGIELTW